MDWRVFLGVAAAVLLLLYADQHRPRCTSASDDPPSLMDYAPQ